jgi:hypothetical protein
MMQSEEPPSAAAGKVSKPKLVDIEKQDDDDNEDPESKSRFETRRTRFTRIIQGGAIAAIVINILAMVWAWSWIMFFAGLCGVGLAGGVVYFQNELRGEDSMYNVLQCSNDDDECVKRFIDSCTFYPILFCHNTLFLCFVYPSTTVDLR